jgi:outer membrane protein assembly factor BamD (BamD/ComL family)
MKRSSFIAGFLAIAGVVWAPPLLGQEQFELSGTDSWERTDSIDPASPQGQLASARRALAQEQPERALQIIERWLQVHEHSPLSDQAYLIRGDALMAQTNYYQALFDYEYIARRYPGSETFAIALGRELEIAIKYAHGLKRRLWGIRMIDATDEAEELLIRIQERAPGSPLAERAGLELGDLYFRKHEMRLAAEAYAIFIENHPRSPQLNTARRRLIYANLATYRGPEFDAVGLYEASAHLRKLAVTNPASAREIGAEALLDRIEESEASKFLVAARWYVTIGDPIAAELTIRRLIETFPGSVATIHGLELMTTVFPDLPPSIQKAAPDYALLRRALAPSAEVSP